MACIRMSCIPRIQVNASPSLATDTVADFRLKFAMVDAALSLTDVEGVYAGKPPASLNGFDLVWENGAAVQARCCRVPSYAGSRSAVGFQRQQSHLTL